jgi:tRNA threonylcarbamoyladenosine biosynthesis protein TsaB
MKLYINTSSREKTIVGLGEDRVEMDSSVWHSQVVLKLVQELLEKHGKNITDITEIEVFPGPGSYTGLRVGITIANALGYALKIPVNGQEVTTLNIVEPIYE